MVGRRLDSSIACVRGPGWESTNDAFDILNVHAAWRVPFDRRAIIPIIVHTINIMTQRGSWRSIWPIAWQHAANVSCQATQGTTSHQAPHLLPHKQHFKPCAYLEGRKFEATMLQALAACQPRLQRAVRFPVSSRSPARPYLSPWVGTPHTHVVTSMLLPAFHGIDTSWSRRGSRRTCQETGDPLRRTKPWKQRQCLYAA